MWCGDAKFGFDEFNIASNIPKGLLLKRCYWLSTLPPAIVTKVTCLVLHDLNVFPLQLLVKQS